MLLKNIAIKIIKKENNVKLINKQFSFDYYWLNRQHDEEMSEIRLLSS